MTTLWRMLVIVVAFTLAMGLMYAAVNTTGAGSGTEPRFEREEGIGPEGVRPFPPEGGERREFREGGRGGGFGMLFGLVKNIGVVAVVTAIVVWWKNQAQKSRVSAARAE